MKRLALPFLAAAFLASAAPLRGMFAMPESVPVDRLISNTEAFLAAHPGKAEAHYTLGRIHYLAFILRAETIPTFRGRDGELPTPASDMFLGRPFETARQQHAEELARAEFGISEGMPKKADDRQRYLQSVSKHRAELEKSGWRPATAAPDALVQHADKAVASFQKAIELDGKNGLYPLGLGSLFEQFADWNDDAKVAAPPPSLAGDLRAKARAQYLAAWSRANPDDSKAKSLGVLGLSGFVSYEAGQRFLKLAEPLAKTIPATEREAIPQVKAAIAKMEKLPMGAITPMVVALQPHAHLDELLAPERTVEFDLRGFGVAERWPWVKADAGLLVWDPQDRRAITSGRQLFGNYTFQIFWRTGYDALRALDDNADGQLTGAELDGLALWFDRNGDARSTRDEVAPLARFGIRSLAVDGPAFDGPHPMNPAGVTFTDGHRLPTWDWIAEPARAPAP